MARLAAGTADIMDPYKQSGVIPVRRAEGELRVLMVTSSAGSRWVIPKGIIEERMSPQDSARKEAREEAGITGRVLPELLGEYAYSKWNGTCRVKVYIMAVEEILDSWPEKTVRRREWLSPQEAAGRVREPELQVMLEQIEESARRLGIA